jgi:hypothetical protein
MQRREDNAVATWGPVAGFTVFGVALVAVAAKWPSALTNTGIDGNLPFLRDQQNALPLHPFAELLKLVVAALIGIVVTAVHRRYHRDKPLTRSLLQAQVLLCVAGAMVMVIIGNSVARAFGVAGAAGIIRFRTPVEDPKDTTLLFLLVGLGMACGVGLLEVALLGTIFLCIVLAILDHFGEVRQRVMILSVTATGKEFPNEHVNQVLENSVNHYEVREMLQNEQATMTYTVSLAADAPLAWISQKLMAGDSAVKSISWAEPTRKS